MVLNSNLTRFGTSTKWNYIIGSRDYAKDFFKQNNLRRYLLKTLKLYDYSSPLLYSHFLINQNPYSPLLRLSLYDNVIYNKYFHERRPHRRRKFKKFDIERFKIYKFRSRLFRSVRLIRNVANLRRRKFPKNKRFIPFNLITGNFKYRRSQLKKSVAPKPVYRTYFNRFLRELFFLKGLNKFSAGKLPSSLPKRKFVKTKKLDFSPYYIPDPAAQSRIRDSENAHIAKILAMYKKPKPDSQLPPTQISDVKSRKFKIILKRRRIKNNKVLVPLTRSQIAFPVSKFFNNVISPFLNTSDEFKSLDNRFTKNYYFLHQKFEKLSKVERSNTFKVGLILLTLLEFKILKKPSVLSKNVATFAFKIFLKELERLINFVKLKVYLFGKTSEYRKKRMPAKLFPIIYKFFKFNLLKLVTPKNDVQRQLYRLNSKVFNLVVKKFIKMIKKNSAFKIRKLKVKEFQLKHKKLVGNNLFLDEFVSTIPLENNFYKNKFNTTHRIRNKFDDKRGGYKKPKKSLFNNKTNFNKRKFSVNVKRILNNRKKNMFVKDKYIDLNKKKSVYLSSERSSQFKVDFRKNLRIKLRPRRYHYKRVYPTLSKLRAKYTKSLFFLSNRFVLKYSIYKILRDLPILNYANKLFKISISPLKFNRITHFLYARFIINRLKQRFSLFESFKVLKRFLSVPTLRGYLIKCSGRFTKKQRASTYIFRKGSVPVGTFRAALDYHTEIVRLKYGTCCIKIWLHR